jgi:hypothetical protein
VRSGRIFRGTLPRHLMPGYDRVVPTGRKYILRAEALIKLALMVSTLGTATQIDTPSQGT